MNLNQLWAGNDYAWYEWRSRGETYRSNARRVRINRAYQKRVYGNERLSGFAEVTLLKDDGEPVINSDGSHRIVEIRARDIAMRWEEYEDERHHREAERERIQKELEEREAKEAAARTAIIDALVEQYHIPRDAVISVDGAYIRLNRRHIEQELGAKQSEQST